MIKCQSERPHLTIDGITYYTEWRMVKLAEVLIKANSHVVGYSRIINSLQTTKGCMHAYACRLKSILEPHGYLIHNSVGEGYSLVYNPYVELEC